MDFIIKHTRFGKEWQAMKFLSCPDKIGTLQGTDPGSSAACLKRREDMSNEPNKNTSADAQFIGKRAFCAGFGVPRK